MSDSDDDFLSELNNQNFKNNIPELKAPKETIPNKIPDKILEKSDSRVLRMINSYKIKPSIKFNKSDKLFSDQPSPILGKDILVLKTKINQYKTMFSKELKNFKIKKTPTAQDLEDALAEMSCIVEMGSVDSFISDSILSVIKMSESLTQNSKNFDITGTADALKDNKQFHDLSKLLYIKYKKFSTIPPEISLIMVVTMTAYLMSSKNKQLKNN